MTYFDLILMAAKNPVISAEEWFWKRVYSQLEGVLDARAALNVPFEGRNKRAMRLLHKAQRQLAIAMWEAGEDDFESWVPRWRKLWKRKSG